MPKKLKRVKGDKHFTVDATARIDAMLDVGRRNVEKDFDDESLSVNLEQMFDTLQLFFYKFGGYKT